MAIDPKIAMLIFQGLQQYGPRLLKALNNQGGLEANPGIEYALESNYDIPLMERKFAKNSNIVGLNDGLTQTDFDYSNDIISHGFPSDPLGSLNPNSSDDDLIDIYLSSMQNEDNIESPAAALAAKMLLHNRKIGM